MDFKKVFLSAAVVACSVPAIAAFQYESQGNEGWLTFDGETTLAFDLGIESRKDKDNGQNNYIDEGGGVADYGWYNLNDDSFGSFNDGLSATFNEDDKIGFWVKDNEGNVFVSTRLKGEAPDYVSFGKSREYESGFSVYGGNFGSNGTQEFYVFKVNTANSNNQNTPSGQPLPGIVATLIVGGGTVLYLKKRKKLYADK